MLSPLVPLHALLALPMFVVVLRTTLLLFVISRSFPVLLIRVRDFVLFVFGFMFAVVLATRFFDFHGRLCGNYQSAGFW